MLTFKEFKKKAIDQAIIPVCRMISADLLTPLAAYLSLAANDTDSFLFESVEGGENLARYSFLGSSPEMIVRGNDKSVRIQASGKTTELPVPMFEYLRSYFAENVAGSFPDLPVFIGGAVGYFGFSCSGWFEPAVKDRLKKDGSDDAALMFFHSIAAFDHVRQVITVISLAFVEKAAGNTEQLREIYDIAVEKNEKMISSLRNGVSVFSSNSGSLQNSPVTSNWRQTDFEIAVRRVKEMIYAGDCYQVVLSQCFTKPTEADAISIYRAIRSLNPSPYMFLLRIGDESVIGASPEMLVRSTNRRLDYRPIAGTRPRGKDQAEDADLAKELSMDEKEIAEHMMLVDLGRNDLGRVAEYGTVKVNELMKVEKYSHVQHLVSSLTAELKKGYDRFDALASCFPAGTVSGSPKVSAVNIISELEPTTRGVYSGAVGYLDYSGNMDVCIAIRTLMLKNGLASVQAGAGIVADSVPEREFEETINKAKALLKAVDIAERGEF